MAHAALCLGCKQYQSLLLGLFNLQCFICVWPDYTMENDSRIGYVLSASLQTVADGSQIRRTLV